MRGKDFMGGIGQGVEQAAVGVIDEDKHWFHFEIASNLPASGALYLISQLRVVDNSFSNRRSKF